jgi:hypothetical protein
MSAIPGESILTHTQPGPDSLHINAVTRITNVFQPDRIVKRDVVMGRTVLNVLEDPDIRQIVAEFPDIAWLPNPGLVVLAPRDMDGYKQRRNRSAYNEQIATQPQTEFYNTSWPQKFTVGGLAVLAFKLDGITSEWYSDRRTKLRRHLGLLDTDKAQPVIAAAASYNHDQLALCLSIIADQEEQRHAVMPLEVGKAYIAKAADQILPA